MAPLTSTSLNRLLLPFSSSQLNRIKSKKNVVEEKESQYLMIFYLRSCFSLFCSGTSESLVYTVTHTHRPSTPLKAALGLLNLVNGLKGPTSNLGIKYAHLICTVMQFYHSTAPTTLNYNCITIMH